VTLERQRGEADMQADLIKAEVTVDIERSNAEAVKARAEGRAAEITTVAKAEAQQIEVTTAAEAKGIKAKGQAQAEVYDLQAKAIGPERAAAVAVAHELAEGGVNITPQTVVGGSDLGLLGAAMTGVLAKALTDKKTDGQRPEELVVTAATIPDTPAAILNEG
jgi:regulator of protease activity HflC (stomatin/prohibitin superfamily)